MTTTTRRLAAVSAPLLLALSLTACGGGASGAPDDASKEDFCEVVEFEPEFPENVDELSEDEQLDLISDGLDEVLEKAKDTGTPEDIPEDAREGFELTLEKAEDLDDDQLREALKNDEDPFEDIYSDGEQDKVDAYSEWSSDYCA
jgi:hypothetical protein